MSMKGHVVILGWDVFSEKVARELLNAKQQVAVITAGDVETIKEEFHGQSLQPVRCNLDSYDSFSDVNIEDSRSVFVNLEKDEDSLIAILNMKKLYDNLQYAVILGNDDLVDTFQTAGVSYVVSGNTFTARMVTSYIYEDDVALFEADLLGATELEDDYDIQQYQVTEENPYINRPYGEAFWDLKNSYNILPIALSKQTGKGKQRRLHKIPEDELIVEAGDYFVVALQGRNETDIEQLFGVKEGLICDRDMP